MSAKKTTENQNDSSASAKEVSPAAADKPVKEEEITVEQAIDNIIAFVNQQYVDFIPLIPNDVLRPADRRRRRGPGIRNYGFIDKTSDLALANPQFSPALFEADVLKSIIRKIEQCRNLLALLQQFQREVSDDLLTLGNDGFSMALMYYTSVRELTRRNTPGAQAVFNMLRPFFRRPNPEKAKPTEPEVERDVRALLHGKKDGKIVIENERPHLEGGKHLVVDEMHRDKAEWKETEEGKINES